MSCCSCEQVKSDCRKRTVDGDENLWCNSCYDSNMNQMKQLLDMASKMGIQTETFNFSPVINNYQAPSYHHSNVTMIEEVGNPFEKPFVINEETSPITKVEVEEDRIKSEEALNKRMEEIEMSFKIMKEEKEQAMLERQKQQEEYEEWKKKAIESGEWDELVKDFRARNFGNKKADRCQKCKNITHIDNFAYSEKKGRNLTICFDCHRKQQEYRNDECVKKRQAEERARHMKKCECGLTYLADHPSRIVAHNETRHHRKYIAKKEGVIDFDVFGIMKLRSLCKLNKITRACHLSKKEMTDRLRAIPKEDLIYVE
jgi:hypothetical protein